MINIKKNDVAFLQEHVFNDNPEKLNKLISSDDCNDILDVLDYWLGFEGFDKNYNLTKTGLRVQEIYDYVYANNE